MIDPSHPPVLLRRVEQLHESETTCKLFLDLCRRYDRGLITPYEFASLAMRYADDAECFKEWEK